MHAKQTLLVGMLFLAIFPSEDL